MLARVWWKEWRQFRPAWVSLLVLAAGLHGLVLAYGEVETRAGELTPITLGWAGLYVVAAGAAAFAGEREGDMLRLLDALPVDRRTLWLGKATFVLGSTLALAVVLLGLSRLVVGPVSPEYRLARIAPIGLWMLVEVGVWSLFWSALMGNALNAAVLALAASFLFWWGTMARLPLGPIDQDPTFLLVRVAAVLAVLAASRTLVVRRPRVERPPRTRPTSDTTRGPLGLARPRFTGPAAWRLAWQTYREGRSSWLLLTAVGLAIPFVILLRVGYPDQAYPFAMIVGILVSVAAGICIFGVDNEAGTKRFLVQMGVRPGLVWTVKAGVWSLALLASSSLFVVAVLAGAILGPPTRFSFLVSGREALAIALPLTGFAAGALCGMVLRRRITAGLVAVLVLLALLIPQFLPLERFTYRLHTVRLVETNRGRL